MQTHRHFFYLMVLFFGLAVHVNAQTTTINSQHSLPSSPTQEQCGTDAIHQQLFNNDPVYKQNFEDIQRRVRQEIANNPNPVGSRAVLTVPVVFHVMHLGEAEGTGSNISYEQLLGGLASLNDAYRGIAPYNSSGVDMEIEFCLASQDPSGNPTSGVNRVDASGTSDYATNGLTTSGTDNEAAIKALSKWSNSDYYNIWVVSEINGNNGGSGTQGFAYFPGASSTVDGTVIMYNSLGYDPTGSRCFNVKSYTNYNITFIHELGHAFGLYHSFEGDGGGGSCPPNTSCTTQGDECCDTPPHDRTSGCPGSGNNACGTPWSGHMHNFMDYSSDVCQTEFTADQKTRARGFLTGSRASLLTSSGCTPVAVPTSDFTTECAGTTIAGCTGTSVQFYDLSTHDPSSWSWTFPGGTPATSTAQNPSITYSTAGTYSVTLVATNAFGTGTTETKTGYITIYDSPTAACANTIANSGNFGYSISNVSFNNINNTTSTSTNGYDDFSCTATTCVTEGLTYTLSMDIQGGHATATQDAIYAAYIDYNDDGDFVDAGEQVASGTIAAGSGTVTRTQNVTIPTTAVESDLLRMRVISDQNSLSGPCDNLFTGSSEDYGVYISPAAAITTQPTGQSGCAGTNVTFTLTATGGVTFQWQEDNGGGFTDISNGGIYGGATTASLTLTGILVGMNGYDYRCVVGNGCDQSVTSSSATLTVGGSLSITTQPTAQTGCVGDTENFTIVSPSAVSYQWQEDNGGGFVNISNGGIYSGATSATLTLTGITAIMNTYDYRCQVSDGSCSGTSNSANLTVNSAPTITTQPTAQSGCVGDTETFAVASATGTFQWQEDNGGGFVNITNGGVYGGATTNTLTLTGVTGAMNGYLYQCVVTDGTCATTSNNVALTVNSSPTITTQPTAQSGCVGDTETFTVAAATGTFQWQEDNGGGFVNITNGGVYGGATTSTLTLTGVTAPMNGYLYQCIVTDGTCATTSNNVALTVNLSPTITTQPTAQSGCVGDTETFTVASATGTFQWQEDNGGGFVNITNGGVYGGATTSTLTLTGVTAPMNGYLYQCVVTDGACPTTSNNVALTVNAAPTITTQPTAQSGCVGDTETFTVAAATGTFQWQEDNGGGFVNITNGGVYGGATTNTLTLTGVTGAMNGYLYQCIVTDGTCATTSNNVALTINSSPTITTQPTAQSGCIGDTETFTVAAATGTFQWQEDNGGGFVNISNGGIYGGATTSTLTLTGVTAPMNGYLYQCIVTDGTCATTSSSAVLTTGVGAVITTNLNTPTTECDNNDFNLSITATGSTAYQWYEFNGVTWNPLADAGIYSGTSTNTLTFTNPTGIDNYEYYCDVMSACGNTESDTTTISLIQVTSQPSHQAGAPASTVSFTSTSINETCGTTWEVNDGSGWLALTPNVAVYPLGVTGNTLDVVVSTSLDANWYRRVVCGPSCNKASDSVQLSIILASDVRGNMYDFDGVDDYIAVDTTPLGPSNTQDISYTYEAWVYPDDIATRQTILGNHNYAGTSGTGLDITGGTARFFKQEGTDVVAGAINVSEWYHLAGTYDAVTDELKLYINGVLIGTTTSIQADAGGPHNIGTHSGNAAVALSDFFNGKMDEIRIWNIARTQTEIRENMHLSLTGGEAGLMLYYQFDRDKTAGSTYGVRDVLGMSHSTAQLPASSYMSSQVHVGGGISNSQTIVGTGNVTFTATNLEIDFPTVHPNGEIVVSHITTENAYAPPANSPFETGYWVVNNFGSVNTALNSTPLFRYADGSVTSALLAEFTLYKRPSREFGAWPQTFTPAATADNTAGNNHCSFTGINDFSVLVPVNNTLLLGQTFLSFKAEPTSNEEVLLSWEVENEINNQHFEIERSLDGITWEQLGLVSSINSPTTYTFLDNQPLVGQNYYRIKTLDFNNQVSYSTTRVVEFFKEQGFWVYPNPNKGVFQIEFETPATNYSVEVYDAVGRKILDKALISNKNDINISNQAAGMYTLKIKMDQQVYYSKVIIVH